MSNMKPKANAEELNQGANSMNAFNEGNTDDFRNKWDPSGNPHMGYGYGHPYYHHHWHPHYGYGYPYGYHHHHYGMYGPGYGAGMYGGYPYGTQQMYMGGGYPTPSQRAAFDPAYFASPFAAGWPQQGFASDPYTFPQGGFPNQGFTAPQFTSAPAGANVSNQVIQGTATPVRKQRTNAANPNI